MSEAVRVDLREATMTESARLRAPAAENQLFLVMDTPPPVRSLLRLTLGEQRKGFEVTRVIEVVDEAEPERGCYGTWVDEALLTGQARVGSEHLEPGISGGGAGVPAPVVIMNTAEMMLADAGDDDDVVLTRSERFAASDEPSATATATATETETATATEGEGETEPAASDDQAILE